MAHQDIGSRYVCIAQEQAQFFGYLLCCSWRGARIAPAITGTVIAADPDLTGQVFLYLPPFKRETAQARINNDGG